MKISKINNVNFKGLWETTVPKKKGELETLSGFIPVLERNATYHPFQDETPEEIAKVVSSAIPVYEAKRNGRPDHYILTEYFLGSTLPISKGESFDEFSYMEEDVKPIYEGPCSGFVKYEAKPHDYNSVVYYMKKD